MADRKAMKSVPREPTSEMEREMEACDRRAPQFLGISTATYNDLWRAGWDAAPAAEPVAQQPPPRDVEADARRYRWLRLNGGRYSTEYGSVDLLGELGEGEIDSDALDAAIDAEMSAKAPTDANRSA